jgi:hypothetical protein
LELVRTYPYLVASLVMLAVCLLGLTVCSENQRWPMILSALLATPCSAHTLALEPRYWHPTRVVLSRFGPEDLLIAFGCGGTVWLISTWLVRDRLTVHLDPRKMAWRYLLVTLGVLAVGGICWLLGTRRPITAMVTAFALVVLCLLPLESGLWPLALAGLAGFTLLYIAVTKAVFTLSPGFASQWNTAALWGPRFLGIPVDEIAAAAGYGMAWPLFAAFLFDARLEAVAIKEAGGTGGRVARQQP